MDDEEVDFSEMPSSGIDLSMYNDEQKLSIELRAKSILLAKQWEQEEEDRQRQKLQQLVAADPSILELYDEPYFWTYIVNRVWLPVACVLAVILISLPLLHAVGVFAPDKVPQVLIAVFIALLGTSWFLYREYVLSSKSRRIVDETHFIGYEPRVLWLLLFGSKMRFKRNDISVKKYYESPWNSLPGWNSWVVELDTPAQEDEPIHHLMYVRNGEDFVNAVSPGTVVTELKLTAVQKRIMGLLKIRRRK